MKISEVLEREFGLLDIKEQLNNKEVRDITEAVKYYTGKTIEKDILSSLWKNYYNNLGGGK